MSSSPSLVERLRGKRTRDIALPNPSGQIDPRLSRAKLRSAHPVRKLTGLAELGRSQIRRSR